jgi:hypothetical protein
VDLSKSDFADAFIDLRSRLTLVWLGGAMLIFFTFSHFFAFKELSHLIGKEKTLDLVFKNWE